MFKVFFFLIIPIDVVKGKKLLFSLRILNLIITLCGQMYRILNSGASVHLVVPVTIEVTAVLKVKSVFLYMLFEFTGNTCVHVN
jgi:hypothetical protein